MDLQCKTMVSKSVLEAVTLKEARFLITLWTLVSDGLAMVK